MVCGAVFGTVNVVGAEYEIITFNDNEVSIKLKNPISDVEISFILEDDGCCFVAGTQVWMSDGKTKKIEEVDVGDFVMSYNEETKEYQIAEVVGLITNPNTTDLARLNLVDGTNVEMNAYHPVYTEEGWKSLTQYEGLPLLTQNDKILSNNGEFLSISSIERWIEENPITTYNLSIKQNHNFFVGNTPILVHNVSCPT